MTETVTLIRSLKIAAADVALGRVVRARRIRRIPWKQIVRDLGIGQTRAKALWKIAGGGRDDALAAAWLASRIAAARAQGASFREIEAVYRVNRAKAKRIHDAVTERRARLSPCAAALRAGEMRGMSDFFSPKLPSPQARPETPSRDDAEVRAAAEKEKQAARNRRGRAATVLTGPGGAQGGAGQAPLSARRLLGAGGGV